MVNTEIPKHYTASPSSFSGTPQLTINRDATLNLDSSNAFEGPEKLLEVWFAPSATGLPASAQPTGLKAVEAARWTGMLDLVHCKVLSVVESDHCDAYLLSESSMFVFPHKLVLKTCGTTTLLSGLPAILEIAALSAGFPHTPAFPGKSAAAAVPYRVFYSRKNYLYPDQQYGPHRSWRDEVRALDRLFQRGSAYMIGKMNGEHWYLYITEPDTRLTPPATPEHERVATEQEPVIHRLQIPETLSGVTSAGLAAGSDDDETLEILMTDLDEENAKQFYLESASAVAENRYYQKLARARSESNQALGNIGNEDEEELGKLKSCPVVDDSAYDVFEQTSSDHTGFSSDEEDMTLPNELTTEGHALGTVVSESCGLADVYPVSKYPDARIDAYLFTPCGFSANGVIPPPVAENGKLSGSTHYFTVHVTPEPNCSYASFETNVPAHQTGRETAEIVEQVANIFRPGRFSVTLFESRPNPSPLTADAVTPDAGNSAGICAENEKINDPTIPIRPSSPSLKQREASKRASRMDTIKGYRRVDRIVHDLDGYDLVFRYYERYDWRGGAPRLGEHF